VTAANSPAYRQGQEHAQARNKARLSCPPDFTDTHDPSDWNGYTVMYDRGWDSIPEAPPHSCSKCKPGGDRP
jgi:hypothetical protein